MFIIVLFILGSDGDSILPKTAIEENDTQISTSVQGNLIQSCVQVSQKDSEDIMQGQLSSGPREFQTKTGQLVVQQVDHLEKADLDKFESKIKVG